MLKTAHSALSQIFCEHIRALRRGANMTQRDLAMALGREHGMVARIELGERWVDFAEAYQIFVALGTNPNREADILMKKFAGSVVLFPHKQEEVLLRKLGSEIRHLALRAKSSRRDGT